MTRDCNPVGILRADRPHYWLQLMSWLVMIALRVLISEVEMVLNVEGHDTLKQVPLRLMFTLSACCCLWLQPGTLGFHYGGGEAVVKYLSLHDIHCEKV